jgi:transposase InsO family protein
MLAEPICGVLPIAPSTYFRHKAAPADPTRRTARAQRDDELRAIIRRIGTEHHQVYRPRKLWRQTGGEILRCSSARIPRRALPRASVDARDGLVGATRGRAGSRRRRRGRPASGARPTCRSSVHRDAAQSALSGGLHYGATWRGFVYVAFVLDIFARRILGWRVSASLATDFVFDALDQAMYDRCSTATGDLVHHSYREAQ